MQRPFHEFAAFTLRHIEIPLPLCEFVKVAREAHIVETIIPKFSEPPLAIERDGMESVSGFSRIQKKSARAREVPGGNC